MQRSVPGAAALRSPERWRAPAAVAAGAALALAAGWWSATRSPVTAGAAVVGAGLGAWALRRVEVALAGLLAVVALLPFGVTPLGLGVAPTLLDVATAGVFFLWLARAAAGRAPARLTPVGAALAVLAAGLVAAYVFSPDPLRPDATARTFAKIVAAHLLFLPVLNLAASARTVRLLLCWLIGLAAVEAVAGLLLYVAPAPLAYRALSSLGAIGYPTGGSVLRYLPDTNTLRATGTAVDPNMLGVLLMIAGAVAGSLALARRPVVRRRWLVGALAPIGACLLLTYSRGSWLGLVAGLLLVGALKYRRLWPAFVLAVALAAASPAAERFTGHLTSGLRAQDRAAAMRLGELRNAAEIISRHPWTGVGWGRGGHSIELEFTLGVSNIYLALAERAGLLVLGLYAACWLVVAAVLWPAVRRRLRQPLDDGVLLGLAAALVAAQVAGMVDHHFVSFPHLVTLLWCAVALAVAEAARADASPAGGRVT